MQVLDAESWEMEGLPAEPEHQSVWQRAKYVVFRAINRLLDGVERLLNPVLDWFDRHSRTILRVAQIVFVVSILAIYVAMVLLMGYLAVIMFAVGLWPLGIFYVLLAFVWFYLGVYYGALLIGAL